MFRTGWIRPMFTSLSFLILLPGSLAVAAKAQSGASLTGGVTNQTGAAILRN